MRARIRAIEIVCYLVEEGIERNRRVRAMKDKTNYASNANPQILDLESWTFPHSWRQKTSQPVIYVMMIMKTEPRQGQGI